MYKIFVNFFLFGLMTLNNTVVHAQRVVETEYGSFIVSEPVLEELMDCAAMLRLKDVRQYGTIYYSKPKGNNYNRHEHSVGVWAVLKRYGAGLEEQIAGLLHDVSHTVFSHVGDYLFKQISETNSYQDDIFEWSLKRHGVDKILEKHGLTLQQVNPKNGIMFMLESNIPDLSADRIEYNLKAGLLTGKLTQQEVDILLSNLVFDQGRWYFKNQNLVKKMCDISLHHTVYVWGGLDNFMLDTWTSDALQRALEIGLLTFDDVHFSVDDIVWRKLCASNDAIIGDLITKILNPTAYFSFVPADQGDVVIRPKFRGLDPWIKQGNRFKRLTEIDQDYAKEYKRVKMMVGQGWPIKVMQQKEQLVPLIQ